MGAGSFDDSQAMRIFGSTTVLRPAIAQQLGEEFGRARDRITAEKARIAGEQVPGPNEGAAAATTEPPPDVPQGGASPATTAIALAGLLVVAAVVPILIRYGIRRHRAVLSGTLVIRSDADATELLRLPLHGHRMSLSDNGFPGRGAVEPVWSTTAPYEIDPDVVAISYSRVDGLPPITGHCRAGKSIILGGHFFSYSRKAE
ncbi:hypothetical protein [Nocardia crassostreae]|uniref:hypothetical protein n=1 Tax=Nocardia crassostreae TaxID=53428 RepID=UPI001C3F8378|nr:hypothetical protein [Nocardia crassostreae]